MDIQLGDSDEFGPIERQNYDRIFTLTMTGGFLSIPAAGMMMDHLGFSITAAFISFSGLMWSLCLLSEMKSILITSFIFYSLFRTFLFAFIFAYAADTMGFKFYGILVGIMFVIAGCVNLLQYPIANWAMGTCHQQSEDETNLDCSFGNWRFVSIVMVLTMVLSFVFAFEDWRRRRSILRKVSSSRLSLNGMGSTKSYGTINI
jgi:MFS family permease